MNPSKFSLADLLTVLGAIVFGFFCFLSFNFLSLGKTIPSITWSTIIALVLGGFAYGAKLLKKTSRNFKTCIIWEGVLLFLFIVSAFVSIIPFSHFFVVSEKKEEIQQKDTANINQVEGLFTIYESYANNRLQSYSITLNRVVDAKENNLHDYYDQYGFVKEIEPKTQVKYMYSKLNNQLYPPNYLQMKQIDSTWLENAKKTITDWKPIGVVNIINKVEKNITLWRNELNQISTFRAQGEKTTDFNFNPPIFENTDNKFVRMGNPTILSIIYAIGLYILMLLSYFITKRHTRYPGLKVIFSTGDIKENEL